MSQPKRVRMYLEDDLRRSAAAGQHNFLRLVRDVLQDAGFEIDYRPNEKAERLKAQTRRGYGLMHMTPPANARCLTFRRVYHYPFWQIDASDERWNWRVAKADFQPSQIDMKEAQRFFGFWQQRLFEPVLPDTKDDGFVYIPLQGRLLEKRSFQLCSPIEMIRRTRAAWPDRDLIATLHPKETYSTEEKQALNILSANDPKLHIREGGRDELLPRCSCIVTQNSSVAFDGLFFEKPVIRFAGSDFHHVTLSAAEPGCFDLLADHKPHYAAFIYWFWQLQSINAGHASASERIKQKLAGAGWSVT